MGARAKKINCDYRGGYPEKFSLFNIVVGAPACADRSAF